MTQQKSKMPVLFIGHGSPMNAIDNNKYAKTWSEIGQSLPRPEAILAISAHWYTAGTRITDAKEPKTVYDMYGFPKELYQVQYPAPGSPHFAQITKNLISSPVAIDNSWGLDHGSWSVLHRLYPQADIPVYQLSVDRNASAAKHFQIGQEIRQLREQGVLIFASGNVVHNLSRIAWDLETGYDWAESFDHYIKTNIIAKNYQAVIDYSQAGPAANLAFPEPDHFYPLLYALGATGSNDQLSIFNDSCTLGSLSMTSYRFDEV
ncbi:MAG: 4,5-DOPA dioxygenase extradiol [Sporomusaceae bacterium]|nr:4,5-DOPA dioxygenase extradiol [Sporomusaceae bacterium]